MQGFRIPFAVAALAAAVGVASCGGGGSGGNDSSAASGQGQLRMAITDAPGDFLAYDVNIKSITLKSANGAEVQTIPIAAHIDFTQYTDLSELFNVLTVPAGRYTQVVLNLDYTDADIQIEGNDGGEVTPAVQTEDGATAKDVSLQLQFPDDQPLEVRAGETAELSIDFDLAASNDVDLDNNVVTVGPVLYASTHLDADREHRVRGLFHSVNSTDNTFVVDLLPLYLRRGEFGEASVQADADTQWLINGVEYSGLAGIAELATLAVDTPIVVLGNVSDDSDAVQAKNVYVGTSVPWVGRQAVQGVVIKRDEDHLTVRGRMVDVGADEVTFSHFEDVTVDLSNATQVTRQVLGNKDLTTDDISVGQRVTVFGALDDSDANAPVMDATAGHVHMEINQVEGTVSDKTPFVMDLEKINGRSPALFDFSGTGDSVLDDVDTTDFEVNIGSLNVANIQQDSYVKVRGYFNQWGAAPADFTAQTIVNPSQYFGDRLLAYWNPSQNTDAILSVKTDGVELNTDTSSHGMLFVELSDNGVVKTAPDSVKLVADNDGQGSFAVRSFRDHEMDVISSFADFTAQISERDDEGQKLVGIEANGHYNANNDTFEVSHAVAVFKRDHGASPDWDHDRNPGHHKGEGHREQHHGHGH